MVQKMNGNSSHDFKLTLEKKKTQHMTEKLLKKQEEMANATIAKTKEF